MDWVVILLLAVIVMLWWIRAAIEPIREYFHNRMEDRRVAASDAELERIQREAEGPDWFEEHYPDPVERAAARQKLEADISASRGARRGREQARSD